MATESELSETGIFNAALAHLGQGAVLTPDQADKPASTFRARYPHLRDALLRSYDWNFAIARAVLAADAEPPLFGAKYQYTPPSDCLRIVSLGMPGAEWKYEGRRIMTDIGGPLKLRYVMRVTDASRFDPIFAEVLAIDLAVACASLIGNKRTAKLDLSAARRDLMGSAQLADASEDVEDEFPDGGWIEARHG